MEFFASSIISKGPAVGFLPLEDFLMILLIEFAEALAIALEDGYFLIIML